jgi:hypothetical protein
MAISGFNIDGFKSNGLALGGARSSLFSVQLTVPPALNVGQNISQKFSFSCRAAELPAATIGTIEVPYFGRRIKIAGDRTFADWNVTIMNDEDFAVRSMIEGWQNGINEFIGNIRDPGFISENAVATTPTGGTQPPGQSYKQTIEVFQYGKGGSIIASYQLIGAYPTDIGAIGLDWDNQNQIEVFPVTFAYDYWIPNQTNYTVQNGGLNPTIYDVESNNPTA